MSLKKWNSAVQKVGKLLHFKQSVPQETRRFFALVIGINQYLDPEIPNLAGAVVDADAVRDFLLSYLNVPSSQIKNLRDTEATKDAIETEIEKLATNSAIKKGDPILIYYAGHGAKAPIAWPIKGGGDQGTKIQMLVPYDFSDTNPMQGKGVLDIKLSLLLSNLAEAKGDNITVVLDCCHSCSGTRNKKFNSDFAVRGINLPSNYVIPLETISSQYSRASTLANGRETTGLLSHVLLAACKSTEEAREGREGGAFTCALLNALRQNDINKFTYEELITSLPSLVLQKPQCEGVKHRILFSCEIAESESRVYHVRRSGDHYLMQAGQAHGIVKGAEFSVYADKHESSALGIVVVSESEKFTSLCIPKDQIPFNIPDSAFAIQSGFGEEEGVRIFIDRKFSSEFREFFQQMEEIDTWKQGWYLVSKFDDNLDLVVSAVGDVARFEITESFCRQHGLEQIPYGVPISDVQTICYIFKSAAHFYRNLRRSAETAIGDPITLECFKLKETDSGALQDWDAWEEEYKLLMPDSEDLNSDGTISINVDDKAMYGYKIENKTARDLYASLFYFDFSDLSISTYYTPSIAKNGMAEVSLPAKGCLTIGYGSSGTAPYEYRLRKEQDVDVGMLKLFLSTEYVDYSDIQQTTPFTCDPSRYTKQREKKKPQMWWSTTVVVVQKGERV